MKNQQKKLITIQDIRNEYLDGSYRKIKAFCLQYFSYKKIGNTYYFKRSEIENKLLSDENLIFKPNYK